MLKLGANPNFKFPGTDHNPMAAAAARGDIAALKVTEPARSRVSIPCREALNKGLQRGGQVQRRKRRGENAEEKCLI